VQAHDEPAAHRQRLELDLKTVSVGVREGDPDSNPVGLIFAGGILVRVGHEYVESRFGGRALSGLRYFRSPVKYCECRLSDGIRKGEEQARNAMDLE
jgi:hypothetical protein